MTERQPISRTQRKRAVIAIGVLEASLLKAERELARLWAARSVMKELARADGELASKQETEQK